MESLFIGLLVLFTFLIGFYLGRFSQPGLVDEQQMLSKKVRSLIVKDKIHFTSPSKILEKKSLMKDIEDGE